MTQTIEEAAVAFLQANATVSGLVAKRIYPKRMPSQLPTMPAIAYTKVSGPRDGVQTGSALHHPRLQFSCYSTDYLQAKQLAKAVGDAFDSYAGPMGNFTRVATDVENEIDLTDDETKLYHTAVDVVFWHAEAAA